MSINTRLTIQFLVAGYFITMGLVYLCFNQTAIGIIFIVSALIPLLVARYVLKKYRHENPTNEE
jgi:hypothetical protein